MKFNVNTRLLRSLLHPVARSAAAKAASGGPDQITLKVDAQAGLLFVRAANSAMDIVAAVPVTGIENAGPDVYAVPAAILDEFLSHLTVEEVHLEFTEGAFRIHNGSFSASFPTFEESLPQARTLAGTPATLLLPLSSFRDAVQALLPAVAADAARPQLRSLRIEVSNGVADLVCTDARVLFLQRMAVEDGSSETLSVSVPADVAATVLKLEPGDEQAVRLEVGEDGNAARFTLGANTVVFPPEKGKYPDYRKILQAENPIKATVSAAALKLGLNLASVTDAAGIVTFDFRGSLLDADLTVTSEDLLPGANSRTSSTFACEYGGEDISVVFPRKRFAEALKALDCQDIEIRMKSPRHAAFLCNAHREESDLDRLVMLMPMAKLQ